MGRWNYKTETVAVGDNSVKVRGMTAGERAHFAEASAEIKKGERKATDLPLMIASFGCVDPAQSVEETREMPSDLLDATVKAIMRLSGFKEDEEKKAFDPEGLLPKFPKIDQSTIDGPTS